MAEGKFITFEGGEGVGKSTQAQLLAARLEAAGRHVELTREPGGTPFAEHVRRLIRDPATAPRLVLAEMLMFYAARADHLETLIRPALAAGHIVICDRFSDSTRAYQGAAGGLPEKHVETLEHMVVGSLAPDMTIVLDLPVAEGLARIAARRGTSGQDAADVFEGRPAEFHERLRQAFLAIAAGEPGRCIVIDAAQPEMAIAEQIWAAMTSRRLLALS